MCALMKLTEFDQASWIAWIGIRIESLIAAADRAEDGDERRLGQLEGSFRYFPRDFQLLPLANHGVPDRGQDWADDRDLLEPRPELCERVGHTPELQLQEQDSRSQRRDADDKPNRSAKLP